MSEQIESDGFALVPSVLDPPKCEALTAHLGPVGGAGRRGLLADPVVAELARNSRLLDLVRPHTSGEPFPVRVIYFDKSPEGNWLVSWHQDLAIALRKQVETPGFGPWSVKEGIPHVHPPAALLERMLTVRVHLDPADESNGALRVLPGSHREGRLSTSAIQAWRGRVPEVTCTAACGDALFMRPLILHASGRSTARSHRRVLHIEFAAVALPNGLQWQEAT